MVVCHKNGRNMNKILKRLLKKLSNCGINRENYFAERSADFELLCEILQFRLFWVWRERELQVLVLRSFCAHHPADRGHCVDLAVQRLFPQLEA